MAAAVQHYWRGRWDQALAEIARSTGDDLGRTFHGAREPGAGGMVLHGVAALIAAHRGRPDEVAAHVAAADALPATEAERESCDFLLVARALVEELEGRPADALVAVAGSADPRLRAHDAAASMAAGGDPAGAGRRSAGGSQAGRGDRCGRGGPGGGAGPGVRGRGPVPRVADR